MFDSKLRIFSLWYYISEKRKKQLIGSFFISIISGLSELITISAVLPFLGVITNSNNISNYQVTKVISRLFNIPINEKIYIPIILFFGFIVVISAFLRLINIWLSLNMAALIGTDINRKVFSNIIHQEYKYFINTNSSKIITATSHYINTTISAIANALSLLSNLILSFVLSFGIILLNPKLSLSCIFILLIIYIIVGNKLDKVISSNSKKIALANNSKIQSIQEAIGSIRSILLESYQKSYLNKNEYFDKIIRKNTAANQFMSEFPRYAIECVALIFIAFISILVLKNEIYSSSSILVFIGALTLGLQKLLPSVQKIYSSWAQIKGCSADIKYILRILSLKKKNETKVEIKPILFKKSIKLDSVFFSYTKDSKRNISNLNLEIFKGQKIGIIGKTGSGKTTIADLIMGLLKPTNGKIYVDGKDIHNNNYPQRIMRWMSSISHVPQNIYLIDGSFKENIAFGLKEDLISLRRVKEAAKIAQIHDFIDSSENGYLTHIGERGIKLSGGQIQRIGIARALFRKSQILIFDEATSALDSKTELLLMQSIKESIKDITMISIAHRHSTLKDFDKIISIKNGSVVSFLDPEDIL